MKDKYIFTAVIYVALLISALGVEAQKGAPKNKSIHPPSNKHYRHDPQDRYGHHPNPVRFENRHDHRKPGYRNDRFGWGRHGYQKPYIGYRVHQLPRGAVVINSHYGLYYEYRGVFFQRIKNGYILVHPPRYPNIRMRGW